MPSFFDFFKKLKEKTEKISDNLKDFLSGCLEEEKRFIKKKPC